MPKKKIIVIGAGFASLSAATTLADKGYDVTILEKNSMAGGKARVFQESGFTFDMGPSWYWMPDVFDRYFERFGKKTSDYYELLRLDPSYTVVFGKDELVDIPAKMSDLHQLFEHYEPNSSQKLDKFLKQAAYKYNVGINNLVYKPSRSVTEFIDLKLLVDMVRMNIFESFHKHIRRYFKHPKLIQLMEFPILFLGAVPQNTPALYSLMNYADISLGTWYPVGGMYKIVEGMVKLAEEKGVKILYNQDVQKIEIKNKLAHKVITLSDSFEADVVVAGADYHHVDKELLENKYQNYSAKYWDKRIMAPSCLIFYLGVNKRLKNLRHHNLFFHEDLMPHAIEIYENPQWPTNPLFYVSCPSQTDSTVAPEGMENLFVLIPVAPDLQDTEEIREKYYQMVMEKLEYFTQQNIRDAVIFKRSYAHNDFIKDYNSFKGNAYGLANTLKQTAILKPSLKNKKVKNLYYTGQLTVPGPGVPPSLISGQVVATQVMKEFG